MTTSTSGVEVIEQDTAENEEIPNMWEFLLPQGIPDCHQLGISFNKKLLDGWVKQPSPCCAAASIAGAWNCLSGTKRSEADYSLTHLEVLRVYIYMFQESIRKKKDAFQRKLGAPVEPLVEILLKELNALGYYLKVQKPKAISKENLRKLLMKLSHQYRVEHPPIITDTSTIVDPTACSMTASSFIQHPLDCLYVLFGEEVMQAYGLTLLQEEGAGSIPMVASGTAEELDNAEERDAEDENDLGEEVVEVAVPKTKVKGGKIPSVKHSIASEAGSAGTAEDSTATPIVPITTSSSDRGFTSKVKAIPSASRPWNYIHDVYLLLKTMSGLDRLMYTDKPSTTAIGNWGLLQVIPLLNEYCGIGSLITIKYCMGTKLLHPPANYITLLKKDQHVADVIQTQWNQFKSEFNQPNQVLLFHLKNHYALIFAVREWTSIVTTTTAAADPATNDGGSNSAGSSRKRVHVRQILTARKGQRPTVWMDFEEVRDVLYSWEGYKILSIQLKQPEDVLEDASLVVRHGKPALTEWIIQQQGTGAKHKDLDVIVS